MGKFYQIFRGALTLSFSNFSKKLKRGTLSTSFYEATITFMPKPKILQKENYRSILLMNIDTKILNKILAIRIQQHIKKIYHDQVGFNPKMESSIYPNQAILNSILTNSRMKIMYSSL